MLIATILDDPDILLSCYRAFLSPLNAYQD